MNTNVQGVRGCFRRGDPGALLQVLLRQEVQDVRHQDLRDCAGGRLLYLDTHFQNRAHLHLLF